MSLVEIVVLKTFLLVVAVAVVFYAIIVDGRRRGRSQMMLQGQPGYGVKKGTVLSNDWDDGPRSKHYEVLKDAVVPPGCTSVMVEVKEV